MMALILLTEKYIAYHFNRIKQDLDAGVMVNVMFENMGELNFVINMDKGHTLSSKEEEILFKWI